MPIFDRLRLVEIIWVLGREPVDAAAVLALTASDKGMDAARVKAEKMFAPYHCGDIAATMGWLEVYHAEDLDAAKAWLERGQQQGVKNPEKLLALELHLCHEYGYETNGVVERILSRNDLPMQITRKALETKAYRLLAQDEWPEAEKIAQRMLSIEDSAEIRLLSWIVSMANGQKDQAQKHFEKAQHLWSVNNLPEQAFNMTVAQGYLILGHQKDAMDWMYSSEREGPWLHRLKSRIGNLARSEKYSVYCRERENT